MIFNNVFRINDFYDIKFINYLAKSDGTTLKEHSIAVLNLAKTIISEAGIEEEKIIKLIKIACLIHDCGKTTSTFQKYLSNNISIDGFPRHNEIGYCLFELLAEMVK